MARRRQRRLRGFGGPPAAASQRRGEDAKEAPKCTSPGGPLEEVDGIRRSFDSKRFKIKSNVTTE